MAYRPLRLISLPQTPAAALRTTARVFLVTTLSLATTASAWAGDTGAILPSSSQPPTTQPSAAQANATPYGARSPDPGQALVSGTSTLHDWTVKSGTINGKAAIVGQWKAPSSPPVTIQSISLVIPVNSLKSTEGSGMDNTMYDALKLKQFPNITYSLTQAALKAAPSGQSQEYRFDATGQLTVAGNSQPVKLDLHVLPGENGQLTITTQIGVKMSDFGVKPPTAMLGVIKSGDPITLKVTWQLATQAHASEDRK